MIDLHNDALLALPPEQLLPYLRQAKKAGVNEIWLSIWTTELDNPLAVITEKKKFLDQIADDPNYPICRLHIEDAWFLTADNLDTLITLKPHSVGLTWNYANCLAGGAHSHSGITTFGYQVIERLEATGIQIDTAHLNRRSFWQFTRVTKRPLLCTHTAFNAVHHHPRNLTNQQVRAIIKSGGMIGLALVPKFLTNATTCNVNDLIKQIVYYKQHFPQSILHWGTDFYGTETLPKGIASYADLNHLLDAKIIGYSVLQQPIIAYQIGGTTAPRRLLITAGMHAREWIGSLAIQTWLKQQTTIPGDLCLMVVVCCNPDGVQLATSGLKNLSQRRQKFLLRVNQGSTDFSLWKANVRAVDLNVNFDANWGQGRANLTVPAPANYIGRKPNSEPENRALLRLIRDFKPTTSIALHTKGNVIYYSRPEDKKTAETLAATVNFKAELSTGSFGGLTDYLALRCGVPSFTIELGDDNLSHPLGQETLPTIMPAVNKILTYLLTGE